MKRVVAGVLFAAFAAAPAWAQKEVTIGYQDMVVPYRIAQEAKELEKATGYKINWKQFGGGGEVIKAMASGAVQIGEVGSAGISAAVSRGEPLELFWILDDIGDAEALVVKNGSGINTIADLKGRKIAVIGGTTTERALKRALEAADAAATLVPVKDGAAGFAELAQGRVDGYAGDRVTLLGLVTASPNAAGYEFIAGDFSVEPYALALPRNDADFRLAVNRALVALFRSGEIDAIFQRWLGGLGQPGTLLHALFYLNNLPE